MANRSSIVNQKTRAVDENNSSLRDSVSNARSPDFLNSSFSNNRSNTPGTYSNMLSKTVAFNAAKTTTN